MRIMRIELIGENSAYLTSVKELWHRNRKTLGYFPEGAFKEHAAMGCLLVAHTNQGDLLGYLLYRVVRKGGIWPQAVIVHLCVDDEHRGKGIARALVEKLRSITKDPFLRIELSCRRDYPANRLWPKLGFVYKGESIGRSGYPVVRWEMTFRQLPLMALLKHKTSEKKFKAVIDTNVLYRLQDPVPEEEEEAKLIAEEGKALKEDWLGDDIALLTTDETFNEIEKNDDLNERARRLSFARRYETVDSLLDDVRDLEQTLGSHFPEDPTDNIRSDIRQLAQSIAGNAHFFITQDTGLLKKSEIFHKEYGIKVLSPGEFIGRIDEVTREVEYHPERLAGSCAATKSKIQSNQLSSLYLNLRYTKTGEKKHQFEHRLRSYMAQPNKYEVFVCWQMNAKPLALIVYDRSISSVLSVPMLRVSQSQLSGTVLRYLLGQVILTSAGERRVLTRVFDLNNGFDQALLETGFTQVEDQWVKYNLPVADNSINLCDYLGKLSGQFPSISSLSEAVIIALSDAIQKQDTTAVADIERRLWPAKILDANIPNYIVSIMPVWAQHLFDEGIAQQTLWGAKEHLALSNENVYYRAERSSWNISCPARILWYVSREKHIPASMHIRASSFLDEVVVGRAKDLFRRFQRLGVYEWRDILRTAKGEPHRNIMAMRFSNTELFQRPVDLQCARNIIREQEDKALLLRSPQPISSRSFAAIYKMGSQME